MGHSCDLLTVLKKNMCNTLLKVHSSPFIKWFLRFKRSTSLFTNKTLTRRNPFTGSLTSLCRPVHFFPFLALLPFQSRGILLYCQEKAELHNREPSWDRKRAGGLCINIIIQLRSHRPLGQTAY